MNFYISGTTDVGIKKPINQDSFFVKKMNTSIGTVVFGCICDGMGGLSNGELASATILYRFDEWLHYSLPLLTTRKISDDEIKKQWRKIIDDNNEKIRDYGKEEGASLGTTLTAILLTKQNYYIVNIGDSRAYAIKKKVLQITKDHSLVRQEIDNNKMTEAEAKNAKNTNILTQCIGVKEIVSPDFYFGKTEKNTTYMLCSDGFRHKLSDEEMLEHLSPANFKGQDGIKRKEELLIDYNKQRNESDNITVVTIVCK